jgi:hypothetical protein
VKSHFAFGLAALVLGAAGGYALGHRESNELAASLSQHAQRLSALSHDVRGVAATCGRVKVVSVPLASAGAQAEALPAAPTEHADYQPELADDPANDESFVAGQELLGAAVRAGTWTEKDAEQLRDLTVPLSLEQRSALLGELAASMNAGMLRYDGMEPPF